MSQWKTNIVANFAGTAWSAVINLTFIPFYIMFMGIEAFGLVGFYVTLQTVIIVLDMALSTPLNRELAARATRPGTESESRDLLRTTEIVCWSGSLLILGVMMCLAYPIGGQWLNPNKLSTETVRHAVMLMGVLMFLRWPTSLYAGGLLGLQRQVTWNLLEAGTHTLRGVGATLILWLISPTVPAFFLWQAVCSVVQVSLARLLLWRALGKGVDRPRFNRDLLAGIRRFSMGMIGLGAIEAMLVEVDKVILSKVMPLNIFGYYVLAWNIAGFLILMAQPVRAALFPMFTQLAEARQTRQLAELYHVGCRLLSIVTAPAVIVAALFSKQIIAVWTGDPVTAERTYRILSILVFGTGLAAMLRMTYSLQQAYRWTRMATAANAIALVTMIPLIITAAHWHGPIGAATVWAATSSMLLIVVVFLMHRKILPGERMRFYVTDLLVPWGTAAVLGITMRELLPTPVGDIQTILLILVVFFSMMAVLAMMAPTVRTALMAGGISGLWEQVLRRRTAGLGVPHGKQNDNLE